MRSIVLVIVCLCSVQAVLAQPTMSNRTVLNESYKGLLETMSIPAELRTRSDGRVYASFAGTVPIHCCTPEEVSSRAEHTHHYCGIFTDQLLAPLAELVYVRVDDSTAEKVFINRSKRLLLTSHDGRLAQWRGAATFESANRFVAGAPVVDADGRLVSVVTARRGNHYAVSSFEGDGGYFATPLAWRVATPPAGSPVYGERWFESRDELRAHIAALPPATVSPECPPAPVLHVGRPARVALVAHGGQQLAHHYVQSAISTDVEYL